VVLPLDVVLLGLVDRLGTVRGTLHRPSLSGTNDSTVHHRRHAGPHPGGYDLVRCDGWLGNLPTTLWRRRFGHRRRSIARRLTVHGVRRLAAGHAVLHSRDHLGRLVLHHVV